MKRLILLNAPVLTNYGTFEFAPLSVEEARQIICQAETVESAIGHAATAEIMSTILNYTVKTNRVEFYQTTEDVPLIFRLKKRLSEGKVLNTEEIEKIGYEFGLLTKES